LPSRVKEQGHLDPAFTWSSLERASDERLLALLRGGVDVAVEAVVRRYHATLLRHAMRFLDPERAALAVQEALVKGILSMQDEPKRVHLRSWLVRIVHNEAVDTSRRRTTDEPRESDDGDARSAEYRERVERLRSIIVGVNSPVAVARAQAVERSRDQIASDLAEVRAHVAVLIHRARASLRGAGGTLFPRLRIRTWLEALPSPGMGGLVTAGAAAVVIATIAGAAMLGSTGGGPGSTSSNPSASSSSDAKPKVAGPRREGGTRTPAPAPSRSRRAEAPHSTTLPAAPVQVSPPVSNGNLNAPPGAAKPQLTTKPKKKTKPSTPGNSGSEPVIVLGEKNKGTTSSGSHGGAQTQSPDTGGAGGP
jgi:DNA-directed RNA polymerase specialized sigma24 family protein